ncbi:MAG TPA: hypothetical protein VF813_03070, partial [Anaerolineaceae bacterium]
MTRALQFGWRIPDFPAEVLADRSQRAAHFRDQIFQFMDVIHGHFNTAWAGDHFFPWPPEEEIDQSLDTHETLT